MPKGLENECHKCLVLSRTSKEQLQGEGTGEGRADSPNSTDRRETCTRHVTVLRFGGV